MNRAMKDSGIPWIGEIPSNWNVCYIKQVMRNKSIKGYPNEQVLSLYRDYGVIPKDSRDDNHNVTSEDTSNYKLVEVGDFVINKMKAWQGSMAVSNYQGIISPAYYICRFVVEDISRQYIHYLLRNDTYKAEYLRLSTGLRVGQWDLNIEDFLHTSMVLPPVPEQQAIADFLDKKCGEIDELIALQEKIIEELKAYKQSVITEAVTKGLNPDVPMKDSGIEWIGQIPEGWKIQRFKDVLNNPLQYGVGESGEPYNPSLPRYIRITDIANNSLKEDIQKLSLTEEQAQDCILEDGDILLARSGGTVGKAFIFKSSYGRCAYAGYLIRARVVKTCSPWFIFYYTQTYCYEEWKRQIFIQSTIQNIAADRYSIMELPIPPKKEQEQIASYLDEKCGEIDKLISIKQSKIDELKEYKKSIIYEYVTGKKDVI